MKKNLLSIILVAATAVPAIGAIPDEYTITPGNNANVTEITTIIVERSNENNLDPYINRHITANGEKIAITQKANSAGNTITMTLATPIVQSGEYTLVIPKATFTYGYDYYEDFGYDNPEMSWKVTVDNPDHPLQPDTPITTAVDPASGSTVPSLEKITLGFNDVTAAAFNTAVTAKPAVTVLSVPQEDYSVDIVPAADTNKFDVTVTPAITVSGEYTILIPAETFNLTATNGVTMKSEEIKLNYVVKAPLSDGDKFIVDGLRYILSSKDNKTASLTFPAPGEDEAYEALTTTIPSSVTYEGETYTVTEIGDLALSELTGLTDFEIPETIVSVGEGAFWSSSVNTVKIPASVKSLGESVFEECKSLKSFTLPATVESVGSDLLCACVAITEVNLPDNLAEIPSNFLSGAAALKSIKIPASVKKIGEFAFSECAELADVNVPDGCTDIDRFAFAYCVALQKLPLPESVTALGHGVFYQAGLTEAALPENITVIPDGTFQCCASLPSFVIGNNVTEIEKEAFYWCFELTDLTFGEKVAKIGENVFDKDTKLTNITCLGKVPATGAVFPAEVYANATLTVPDEALEAYKKADGWKEFANIKSDKPDDPDAGVGSIATEVPADYYTLQGARVAADQLAPGIYIRISNGHTEKVLIGK